MAERKISIDLLKMVAILFVIITHFITRDTVRFGWPFHIGMAVPIFLIVTGYNWYFLCQKNNYSSLSKWFQKDHILKWLRRFLAPFIAVVSVEFLLEIFIRKNQVLNTVIRILRDSGLGPGGYYFAILIQLFIIFPFLYLVFAKWPVLTGIAVFGFSLLYEMAVKEGLVAAWAYRLISIRCLFFIVMGMCIASKLYASKIKWGGAIIGTIFIYLINYTNWREYTIFTQWITTAFPTAFYAAFFVHTTIDKLENRRKRIWWITLISKASYHIFLAQMFYYYALSGTVKRIAGSSWVSFCLSIGICLAAGILFFHLDKKFSEYTDDLPGTK